MKAIRCDLPFAEQIEIHPMADLHIGDSWGFLRSIPPRLRFCLFGLVKLVIATDGRTAGSYTLFM